MLPVMIEDNLNLLLKKEPGAHAWMNHTGRRSSLKVRTGLLIARNMEPLNHLNNFRFGQVSFVKQVQETHKAIGTKKVRQGQIV